MWNFVEYSACSHVDASILLSNNMCGLSVKTVQCFVYSSGVVCKGLKIRKKISNSSFLKMTIYC